MKKRATVRMSMFCPDGSPTPIGMDRNITKRAAGRSSKKVAEFNKLSRRRPEPASERENAPPSPRRPGRRLFSRPTLAEIGEAADALPLATARPPLRPLAERQPSACDEGALLRRPELKTELKTRPEESVVEEELALLGRRGPAADTTRGAPKTGRNGWDEPSKTTRPLEDGVERPTPMTKVAPVELTSPSSHQSLVTKARPDRSEARPSFSDGPTAVSEARPCQRYPAVFREDPAAPDAASSSGSEQSLPYFTPRRLVRRRPAAAVLESSDESGSPFLTVPSDESDVVVINSDSEWDDSDLLSVSERAAVAAPAKPPRGAGHQERPQPEGVGTAAGAPRRERPRHNSGSSSGDELEKFKRLYVTPRRKARALSSTSENEDDFINDDSTSEDELIYHRAVAGAARARNPRPDPLICASDESPEATGVSPDEPVFRPPRPQARKPLGSAARATPGPRSTPRQLSFMSSLATHLVEGRRRCPQAAAFVTGFKTKKLELARHLLRLINAEVFEDKLAPDLEIKFNKRMLRTAGFCYSKQTACGGATVRTARIELSEKVVDSAERLRDTLVHELCHAAAWVVSGDRGGHGPVWRGWAGRVQRRFPELPPVSRCHSYEIRCKYTYRCTRCGYSFGRHSKSLDTQRKVCGRCHGRFECVLTAALERPAGAAPATPRTPAPFALFVKDNYGSVKKDSAGLKHAEIMRVLGQQFAAAKITKEGEKVRATECSDF
ncbi:acidic repeat-containing protein-like [Pollicipes pollicipes]|uniref:acidic repeat-containing protein-like n=1 Tax=Pollicipes pollicipes TaxID=41117 RepID=UPI0018856EB2|nr:acidic repeat-containing protein-like [Pollicipes pollicipes]